MSVESWMFVVTFIIKQKLVQSLYISNIFSQPQIRRPISTTLSKWKSLPGLVLDLQGVLQVDTFQPFHIRMTHLPNPQ